jgi:alpha-L-fucosidase
VGHGRRGDPISQYTAHAATFRPTLHSPCSREKLAKTAGMKYMVMTTMHHEGFCNFDTKLTDYSAPKQGLSRDLVRECVDAARATVHPLGHVYGAFLC